MENSDLDVDRKAKMILRSPTVGSGKDWATKSTFSLLLVLGG